MLIRKASGEMELFNKGKLRESLLKTGANTSLVEKLTEQVTKTIKEGDSTNNIYRKAHSLLNRSEKTAASRYSLRRAIIGLGPTGFPFEKFIGEIFQKQGYSVKIDQIIKGRCVEHEIDVIAEKPEKLILAEVKFHNRQGIKSDLQVTLYVKARYEDLKEADKGALEKSEMWLVTNTKFTKSAIKYGECVDLNLLGWGYPKENNLEDIINKAGLHPLTCLSTLTKKDKNTLMTGGIVLCRDISENMTALSEIGLSPPKINSILEEINRLCTPNRDI